MIRARADVSDRPNGQDAGRYMPAALANGTTLPDGRSNIPAGYVAKNASTSVAGTTSAYFAFMSQRLIAWLARQR